MYTPSIFNSTIILVVGILASSAASSASFNCSKAKGCVENVICQSPQLSQLDSEMAQLYFSIKQYSSRRGAKALLSSQRSWLKRRNTCGCDANCLVGYYNDRINLFNEALNSGD